MARAGKRVDGNHAEVVLELRRRGYSVADTHEVGEGFGDIVVGLRFVSLRLNFIFEIKDPASVRWVKNQKRKLEGKEKKFHAEWKGQVAVIESAAEALEVIEATLRAIALPAAWRPSTVRRGGEGAGLGCGSVPGRPLTNETEKRKRKRGKL